MKIRCEECSTVYELAETLLEPGGSKVRCSRCGHIFQAAPPAPLPSSLPEAAPGPSAEKGPDIPPEEEGLDVRQAGSKQKYFWVLGIVSLAFFLAVSVRYFYFQHYYPDQANRDLIRKTFFLPSDLEGNKKLSLVNVKSYFQENNRLGPILVAAGEIINGYPESRQGITIRGSLLDGKNRVLLKQETMAGLVLNSEELGTLSWEEISRLPQKQPDRLALTGPLLPSKTISFMLLFPKLPAGARQISIEVLGSQKIQSPSSVRTF